MKNTDVLPDIIAELIQHKTFEELNESEKNLVLQYMAKEDYQDYSIASQLLKIDFQDESIDEIPPIFHQTFKSKSETKNHVLHIKAWQLAASLILISSLWIFSLKLKSNPDSFSQLKRDTIYLTQQLPAEVVKVHDTVFIQNTVITEKKKSIQKKDTAFLQTQPSIEELQIDQLNAVRNKRKNKGIKGDTLLKNFEFVRI